MSNMEVIHLNEAKAIICDSCGVDYTNSDRKGGVLFNKTAYCPDCSGRIISSAKKFNEERYLIYPEVEQTFSDFVYNIRPLLYAF